MYEIGGLHVDLVEVIREIPALAGALTYLITEQKRTTRVLEMFQRVGGSISEATTGGPPQEVIVRVGALLYASLLTMGPPFAGRGPEGEPPSPGAQARF